MPAHPVLAKQAQAQPTLPQSPPQPGAGTGPAVAAPVKPKPAVAGPPLPPHRRQSRHDHRWFAAWVAMVILLLLISGVGGLFAFLRAEEQAPASPTVEPLEVPLGSHPQIKVDNDIGTIHVSRGKTGNKVSIQKTIWSREGSAPTALVPSLQIDKNTISIKVERSSFSLNSSQWIDLDITLPVDAGLMLTTTTGNIAVTGINAPMNLTSNAGSITVEQSQLSGTSVLRTTSGSISFQGTIDTHSTASFLTGSGSSTVTLPSEAAFHVDATDDLGTITVDFPGVTPKRLTATHSEAYGYVGKPPRARVILESRSGSITLQAG